MREREREAARLQAGGTPSLDLVFDLLADRRRRYALYCLHDSSDEAATVEEVTKYVVSLEESDANEREHEIQVATSLKHVHLPRLEDAGVVEHDSRSETVRYWPQPSLEEWLEHAFHKELS